MSTGDQNRADALALLERCHVEFFLSGNHPNEPGLREATEIALRGVQAELLLLTSPVEFQTARRLMRERLWALAWWIDRQGHRRAKERLLELTDDAPLTLCMGDAHRPDNLRPGAGRWTRKTVAVPLRDGTWPKEVGYTVKGCQAIILDSTSLHASSRMWRHFCADCKSRKPWRRRGREVRADIKKIRQGNTAARPRSPELRAKLEQLDAEFGAVRDAFNRGDHDAVHEHLASLAPPPPGDIAQLKSYINYGGTSG